MGSIVFKLTVLRAVVFVGAFLAVAGHLVAQMNDSPFTPRSKLRPLTPADRHAPDLPPQWGGPLVGLNAAQLRAFKNGLEEFQSVETPAGGLGPIFNERSCAACHVAGGIGGAGAITVTRFGRMVHGKFDAMEAQGGSLLQSKAIDPEVQEFVPATANVLARRLTTPLFGAGLIEAIDDENIIQNALRRQPDRVSGRAALVFDVASGKTRVGRFGWKAQQATLLAFAGDAYLNEMGITNRFFPEENAPNGNKSLLKKWDRVADIEDAVDPATGQGDVDHAADFMRLLAPPLPLRMTASALAGARIFDRIACSACHVPTMITGKHAVLALAYQPVALHSDLLLHYMGKLGDGIAQADAKAQEIRTAPLWGLRVRGPYLHDGRAKTVDEAIRAHEGEGAASRDRYEALSPAERRRLLDYLGSI